MSSRRFTKSLQGIPARVQHKAHEIAKAVGTYGEDYRQFRGKRVKSDRTLLAVPLPGSYRLLFGHTVNGWVPIRALSHETYNRVIEHLSGRWQPSSC